MRHPQLAHQRLQVCRQRRGGGVVVVTGLIGLSSACRRGGRAGLPKSAQAPVPWVRDLASSAVWVVVRRCWRSGSRQVLVGEAAVDRGVAQRPVDLGRRRRSWPG